MSQLFILFLVINTDDQNDLNKQVLMMMLTVHYYGGKWVINDQEQLLLSESRFLTCCVVNQAR